MRYSTVCYIVLQCSMLFKRVAVQYVAVFCILLQGSRTNQLRTRVKPAFSVLQCAEICCSAVCSNLLQQYIAVCCSSILQCVAAALAPQCGNTCEARFLCVAVQKCVVAQ